MSNLGIAYHSLGQYEQAIDFHQQSLEIAQKIGDLEGEAVALSNLGLDYYSLGQYEQAIDFHQQSLGIAREIGDLIGVAASLGNLGTVYYSLGQYERAIDFHQQSLEIKQEIVDRRGVANSLGNLGLAYDSLGQYERAIDFHQQSLEIAREIGDRRSVTISLGNLGNAYYSLDQYERAIDFHQQSLEIAREIGARQGEANSLGNLGIAYYSLGQYERGIDFHQQSLEIKREIGDHQGEAISLGNLGLAYASLGQYERAIDFHHQHLEIAREIGDRQGEAMSLSNLGNAYYSLGQYERAIDFHQQSLEIARDIGARESEAIALGNLGNAYYSLGQYEQAIRSYQGSLAISQEIGNRSGEGIFLSNIGELLAEQDQAELAIVFYKRSVNVREDIRGDIRGLSTDLQQSFTDTVADDYRALADLLLQQNRIPEAQRVLDLLKVQELDEYFQDIQRNGNTEAGVAYWQPEQRILDLYVQTILAAEELALLEATPPDELSPDQRERLIELQGQRRELSRNFNEFLDLPEVTAALTVLRESTEGQSLEPEQFKKLIYNLAQLPTQSVLLYPLILEDRLELVLISPDGTTARHPVPVTGAELNRVIVAYGQALKTPSSDLQPLAQQLYAWLIAPLEAELSAVGAETIIYAPDGALRYIPLAALHDGNQWLAERYSITHITAASLSDLNAAPADQLRLLAGACVDCSFSFEVSGRQFEFGDLPFTEPEVNTLAKVVDENSILLNQAFSPEEILLQMGYHNVLHLATHAAFVEGQPDESFIVFGDSSRVNLRELRNWEIAGTELVVLSACETAVGSAQLGNGAEVLGLGYQMQNIGAQATLASLWKVSDGGTQRLMNAFYAALIQTGITKTEALQRAQIALLTGDYSVVGLERGPASLQVLNEEGEPRPVASDLSHPYYWAPFILIGNGA